MGSNPTLAWMFSVCVRFSVCVQVETLRRADHPSKESYRLDLITEVKGKVSLRQPKPELGCTAKQQQQKKDG
jgi:hypothetical protein